jgi:hypothetical protein
MWFLRLKCIEEKDVLVVVEGGAGVELKMVRIKTEG